MKTIKCSCGSEYLCLEKDEETGTTDICILTNQNLSSELNFDDRLRYIWKILTTGIPYTDQIILNKEGVNQLKDFLNEN